MSIEIMQLLQVIPQANPLTGTQPEAPAGSAATTDLFASLMAGLLVQPATTTDSAELPATTAETVATDSKAGTTATSDDITPDESAMMSLASLIQPLTTVRPDVPVTETPVPTGTTIEASAVIPAQQAVATATAAAPPATAPAMLSSQQAGTVIPQTELPRDTIQPKTTTEATPAASSPQAAVQQPAPATDQVEVLKVTLEPAKATEVKPQAHSSEPLPETAPAPDPEVAAADKPAPRTMGPTAAYPDRIPVIPKGVHASAPAATVERAEVTETARPARPTETAPLTGVKPQEVEVVIKGEADQRQSTGEQEAGGNQTADTKVHTAPVQSNAVKSFEPTLQGTTKPEHQPAHGLRDSIMAQVKGGIATREPAKNGEISIRLNPVELGELRINVQVVDQHVKVEVLAANSQVRDVLLNNLDSLKENFSRQNLTMTGFDVSTGSGQGFEQFFREGRAAGQGGTKSLYTQGMTDEDEVAAMQPVESFYYTDRRDSILDVRL